MQGFDFKRYLFSAKKELDWFYQEGASNIFPDRWESFLEPIPVEKRDNLMQAYYEILTGEDHSKKLKQRKHGAHGKEVLLNYWRMKILFLISQMISLLKHLQGLNVIIL